MKKSIVFTLIGLVITASVAAAGLPSKQIITKYYTVVRQIEISGQHATSNEIRTYEVGYNVVKENDSCWKISTTDTDTETVPVTLKAGRGQTTFYEEHPVLLTEKQAVTCGDYSL